jgi:hypothetical protein
VALGKASPLKGELQVDVDLMQRVLVGKEFGEIWRVC